MLGCHGNLAHALSSPSPAGLGSVCLGLGFRSLVAWLAPFERVGTNRANFFGNGKCELIANSSATTVTI